MKSPQFQVMTANRLIDGQVVYLAEDGTWVEHLSGAGVAPDPDTARDFEDRAERAAEAQLIVSPYLFAVAIDEGPARPLGRRETIRAAGPSVGTDLHPSPGAP